MCVAKGLQAPSCLCPSVHELLKLYLQWQVTAGEEKQLFNHFEVGQLLVKKDLDIVSGRGTGWAGFDLGNTCAKRGYFPRRQLCKNGVNEARLVGFCSSNTSFILRSVGGKGVSVFGWMLFLLLLEHNGEPQGSVPE